MEFIRSKYTLSRNSYAVTVQTYREIVVFSAPQSETMDGGAFANGRMDAPLSDKEQKIRLFPMHSTKRPVCVNSNHTLEAHT